MSSSRSQRVAVIIPAKDEAGHVAATVRAARAIPHVDLVLVVDDGSDDDTQHAARSAGAVVVRHSVERGKATAMETGAAVVAMRDVPGSPPRHLLFLDAGLGETAVATAPVVVPVLDGEADCAIAVRAPGSGPGGRSVISALARKGIAKATGWTPMQPLSAQRCVTREAFDAVNPLARGWGVETGMIIDLLVAGYTLIEVPCELDRPVTTSDFSARMRGSAHYRDVALAINSRKLRRIRVPRRERGDLPQRQKPGYPYRAWVRDVTQAASDHGH
ncbi:glycosyltransferase [Bogoriella caseilytica]|uniref:Glucosyl-3-phosphoglycerate synthase n=1 Tax=Bogoriella caseilytica TaxID=56055 RepID=A0A3N2BD41_9MICO|nr:glycosyltransferase [Bogoriella caseilytica]ROR73169.1 glycosyl transferase family 2 [Bogoriella caseilytica]